ncbi:hypothetical protein QFZ75_000071 [Streptomyces sp. V3I8]|nr:hypothetical protein [Streptomyces sp. V3I8]
MTYLRDWRLGCAARLHGIRFRRGVPSRIRCLTGSVPAREQGIAQLVNTGPSSPAPPVRPMVLALALALARRHHSRDRRTPHPAGRWLTSHINRPDDLHHHTGEVEPGAHPTREPGPRPASAPKRSHCCYDLPQAQNQNCAAPTPTQGDTPTSSIVWSACARPVNAVLASSTSSTSSTSSAAVISCRSTLAWYTGRYTVRGSGRPFATVPSPPQVTARPGHQSSRLPGDPATRLAGGRGAFSAAYVPVVPSRRYGARRRRHQVPAVAVARPPPPSSRRRAER